tara:strand:+ start:425 stop:1672 length:1248 start_codon:yes stop_codon:yes gene_type:complete
MLCQFKKNSVFKRQIILLIILVSALHSQDIRQNEYSIFFTPNISNQWWTQYNNYGQVPSEIYFNYNNSYMHKNINFSLSFISSKDKIYFGESFVQSKVFNNTYIKAGRYYKDFSSYLNDSLSTGSILISNNAEPIPKVGIISSYKFKETQNFDFNFGISHAVLAKSKFYKTAPMIHEKFIYLNYSKDQNEFSMGFVHEAMWGGSTEEYGDFPDSFKDFFKILISADGPLLPGEAHANALGNHLGIWDFYYKRTISEKELKLYYQHFFEDTSGLRFDNGSDGLWGMELSNVIKNTDILIEYLNTMNQDSNPPYVNENYYNHYQYKEGWSYKGYSIGNPFIDYKQNNPSKVLHVGVSNNKPKNFSYKLLLSRKIDSSDFIKYQASIGKIINQYRLGFVVTGEKNKGNNISMQFSYDI